MVPTTSFLGVSPCRGLYALAQVLILRVFGYHGHSPLTVTLPRILERLERRLILGKNRIRVRLHVPSFPHGSGA